MTFRDLILRVAEELGVAFYDPTGTDNSAQIPQDPHDLDVCKRAVNDGYQLLRRSYSKWNCLQQIVTFTLSTDGSAPETIAADTSRYALPWYVTGRPLGDWSWDDGTGTYAGRCIDTDIESVMRSNSGSTTTGPPLMAAVTTIPESLVTQGRMWEVRFYPTPNLAFRVRANFRCEPVPLKELDQRHVFGAQHDQTLVACAVWTAKKRDLQDADLREMFKGEYETAVAQSIGLDRDLQGPRTLGVTEDPSNHTGDPEAGRWGFRGLQMYNGVAVN